MFRKNKTIHIYNLMIKSNHIQLCTEKQNVNLTFTILNQMCIFKGCSVIVCIFLSQQIP